MFFPHRRHAVAVFKDAVYDNQEAKLRFMGAMHSIARVTAKAVATAFDLSRFKTACDLGGEERNRAHAETLFWTERRRLSCFGLPPPCRMHRRSGVRVHQSPPRADGHCVRPARCRGAERALPPPAHGQQGLLCGRCVHANSRYPSMKVVSVPSLLGFFV